MTALNAAAEAHFRAVAPEYMRLFMQDFDCSELDAAAVFGNAGYESLGFTKLQEMKPVAGRGGFGWFQWTGPRRKTFEAYCARHGYDTADDEANYKFLWVELHGDEKGALPKLKAAKTLEEKVVAFEEGFERAGVKAYPKRQEWAAVALDALQHLEAPADPVPASSASLPPPAPAPSPAAPAHGAAPGWLPLLVIGVLALLVFAWVWLSGQGADVAPIQTVPSVVVPDGAPVPLDRPMPLFGKVSQPGIWTDVGLQILLSFIGPLISAAATAIVGWVVYWWGRVLKSDFDKKSADQLHAALERGILAAVEALGSRASKASLLAGAADYAETWNGDTVKRFGLTHDDLKQLAAPHLATVKRGGARVG